MVSPSLIRGVMLSLRSILREAHMRMVRGVPMRARSFGTKVPQDDAESEK
jgi:hypothetical protein